MSDRTVDINHVTEDPNNGELVLYLVEDGPWSTGEAMLIEQLQRIEKRILDAAEGAATGCLADVFPDSMGAKVRIQVDSPHGAPPALDVLISELRRFLCVDPKYSELIRMSKFISALRLVTGKEMGRFRKV